jgi:hypothetical protein
MTQELPPIEEQPVRPPEPPPGPLPTRDIPVLGWAFGWGKAIALGIKDTAQDMLDEGRRGAHRAYDEGWTEFDAKTRYRRHKR